MRVLASADLHGRLAVYEWLVATARGPDVDAVLLAGDLLGCSDGFTTPEEAQRHEAAVVADLLASAGVPVLYIMGNDDLVELESRSPDVRSIHARRVTCGRFGFVGYQYSPPFMGGAFERPEAAMATDLSSLTSLVDARTVFVSHSPALGILDPGLQEAHIGSASLGAFLESCPFLAHVHGHSHEGFGRSERHFNVASAGIARAMILDLDTMRHEVVASEPSRTG
jgi:Icc-related predicted phosphoesterase